MNHYPNVSEETKEKVNTAIKELNFVPNTIAAALSSKQSGRVALIMNLNTQTQAIDEIGMHGAMYRRTCLINMLAVFMSTSTLILHCYCSRRCGKSERIHPSKTS